MRGVGSKLVGGAGVKPGDIVVSLEGIPVGSDGTMMSYCDILRSNQPGRPIGIEVARTEEDAILAGQVGGRPLEFERSLSVSEQPAPGAVSRADRGGDWNTIWDQTGRLVAAVPPGWQWSSDSTESDEPFLLAGPNLRGVEDSLYEVALDVRGTGIAVEVYPEDQPFRVTDADMVELEGIVLDSLEIAERCDPITGSGILSDWISDVSWPIVHSYRCAGDSTLVVAVGIIQAPITGDLRATLFAYGFARSASDLPTVLSAIGSVNYLPD